MEPTYTLWTPRVAGDAIRFNATPGSVDRWPRGGEAFYGALLKDLEVDAVPAGWAVDPYRASYHGPAEPAGDPRVDWKVNWRVAVRAAEAPEPRVFADVYETEAFDAGPEEARSGPMLCLVIADFRTREALDAARAAVAEELGDADGGRFEAVEVGGADPFWQLQVEVGRFAEEFYADDAPLARRIQARCRELGGWTTFEERVIGLERPQGNER